VKIKCHFLTLLATTLVAGSFLASEELSQIINPLSLTLLRFLGATLILSPIVFSRENWRKKILPLLPRALIISLFYALFFIAHFESFKTTTAINTGALFTLIPFITAIISIIVFKETLSTRELIAYLAGAIGTSWIVFSDQLKLLFSFTLNEGDLIFMLAVISMSLYTVARKYLYRDDEMVVLVFATLLGGSFWTALALIFTNQSLNWHLIQGNFLFQMIYLIIGATLMTVYLYQKTTVILGANRVSAYIYLTPALVVILKFFIDGTSITMNIMLGIIMSAVSTIILQKNKN
jgi:drug/metabolite transporter (DMT)-like permease